MYLTPRYILLFFAKLHFSVQDVTGRVFVQLPCKVWGNLDSRDRGCNLNGK